MSPSSTHPRTGATTRLMTVAILAGPQPWVRLAFASTTQRWLQEPLMSLELPARPSHVSFPYDQDRVDIALYLVATDIGAAPSPLGQ